MNKQTGNMYPWVTHTWNPIRGECPHGCEYCYMRRFKVGKLRLEKKEFKTNLGSENVIFVGSSIDMFAWDVPTEWIGDTLEYCSKFDNTYLFQTKNPQRLYWFIHEWMKWYEIDIKNMIIGTTIETTSQIPISKAPIPVRRYRAFKKINWKRKMVSIEPIIDFNLPRMVKWMTRIAPEFVSIGADSKGTKLNEPTPDKLANLITDLEKITEVRQKKNLKRLLNGKEA